MHIHIINLNLSGINRSEYEAAASELTTAFSEIPGLKRKHWLAHEDNNTFGGVYIFDTNIYIYSYIHVSYIPHCILRYSF